MKGIKIPIVMLFIVSFSINAYSQFWKQYSDSAKAFSDQKKTDKAIEYYYKAIKELEKDSMWTNTQAGIYHRMGAIYYNMDQYSKAEPHWLETKQIKEKIFGIEHPDYASSCNNLAILYWGMGQFEKAESLYEEAKNITEKALGKVHPSYALYCDNLAILYMDKGQYGKAESLFLEAKSIQEKVLGKEHPDYALTFTNLAELYRIMGQYEKAEPLYKEAIEINEKVVGKQHPNYALNCNNLAILYWSMGQFEKAESLYEEAKNITEKALGKEHPQYARSCNNLAMSYRNKDQYVKAESLYLEAKQIKEKVLGKEHPEYASTCNNLAILYTYIGQFEKAESLFEEAKNITEKALGKEHPAYASHCENLANLYKDMGQYEKAESLYKEAKQIEEDVLGKEHYDYTETCINLGNLYWRLNKTEKANDSYSDAFQFQNIQVNKIFQFTNEVEQQSYLKKIGLYEKEILSFYTTTYPYTHQAMTFNVSLSRRNLILSSSQQLRSAINNTNDTSIKKKYNNWMSSREQLSFWYSKPIADRPVYVKDLEERANTLEKELTSLSSEFRKGHAQNEIEWQTIQQNLKPNEATIEFIEFQYSDGKRWTDSTYYIALVLRKDKPEPVLVRLFEKKQLDKLLNNTENLATDDKINTLYAGNRSLYNLAWKPLEKYLNGISKVYFASAGNLFKISFAALPVNDKEVLGDKYQLIQLNTTATVIDNTQSTLTVSDKIQLYGGIRYDADSATLKQAVASYQLNTESTRSLPADLERGAGFQYLPGTQKETEAIKKQATNTSAVFTILSGTNATEESIKALTGKNSPSVLHIATHGFFFPDPKDDKKDSIQRKFETSGKAFKQSDNPLFRSGLLFAGANNAWQGKPIKGIEDGILTAYEVSNLYLPNTKLVVLSACETALGDIQGSEGVYGLQRAFKMAGVKNLVMSLWKVPDAETAEFMQVFYKNLFAKQTISNAFYNAQQIMKNKYRAEPYKWAAWVLVR